MAIFQAQPAANAEKIMDRYGNMLFAICLTITGNKSDAEDALQETLIAYLRKAPDFKSDEHQKAWLIKVATNKCRDIHRRHSKNVSVSLDDIVPFARSEEDSGILSALMELPEKYRTVLVLYYVQEYSIGDIAKIIGRTPSAVKMRLKKGRELLKEKYAEEYM